MLFLDLTAYDDYRSWPEMCRISTLRPLTTALCETDMQVLRPNSFESAFEQFAVTFDEILQELRSIIHFDNANSCRDEDLSSKLSRALIPFNSYG